MSSLPVESMLAGGLFWFTDLTISDPYYLLPLATSLSLFAQIHFAADGMSLQQYGQLTQTLVKVGVPAITFLFTMNFPSVGDYSWFLSCLITVRNVVFFIRFQSLTLYWLTSNVISVAQARLIRQERVRKVLGLQKLKKFTNEDMKTKKKSFRESVREGKNRCLTREKMLTEFSFEVQAFRFFN
jgi:YidC/Oxa1 family membrane protein insertase